MHLFGSRQAPPKQYAAHPSIGTPYLALRLQGAFGRFKDLLSSGEKGAGLVLRRQPLAHVAPAQARTWQERLVGTAREDDLLSLMPKDAV
jgi:hypothetical protein